jgi:xanthine/uracil permease
MEGLRVATLLILETGFCVGAIMAFLLNLILPEEIDQASGDPSLHDIKVGLGLIDG